MQRRWRHSGLLAAYSTFTLTTSEEFVGIVGFTPPCPCRRRRPRTEAAHNVPPLGRSPAVPQKADHVIQSGHRTKRRRVGCNRANNHAGADPLVRAAADPAHDSQEQPAERLSVVQHAGRRSAFAVSLGRWLKDGTVRAAHHVLGDGRIRYLVTDLAPAHPVSRATLLGQSLTHDAPRTRRLVFLHPSTLLRRLMPLRMDQ